MDAKTQMATQVNFTRPFQLVGTQPDGETILLTCEGEGRLALHYRNGATLQATPHAITRPDVAQQIVNRYIQLQVGDN